MTIWMPVLAIGAAALVLSACGMAPPPQRASSGSEATLHNVDAACVRRELVRRVASRGWSVRQNDDAFLLVARPSRRAVQQAASGASPPEDRLQFTYVPLGSQNLRVIVQGSTVPNPGSRNEQVIPVQDGPRDQQYAQQTFDAIGKACAARS